MKHMLVKMVLVLACAGAPGVSHALIIDANARSNNEDNPIEVFLGAGTYNVKVIGVSDGGVFNAWSAWSTTTCGDTSGCVNTNPTTVTGYLTGYAVLSPSLASVSVDGVTLIAESSRPSEKRSFFLVAPGEDTQYRAYDGMVYPDPLSALAEGKASNFSSFSLTADGLVGFAIHDSTGLLGDNRGGISLLIQSATSVAEPASAAIFGLSLVGLSLARRRKASATTLARPNLATDAKNLDVRRLS